MPSGLAVVTGASGGFGLDFARLLAADHHPLVLVARSEGRLRALADELAARHGVAAHVVAMDLAAPEAADRLAAHLAALDAPVDVLVNNAGIGSYGPFAETPAAETLAMLTLNVTTLTLLTRALLPAMLARRRGRILNVASTAAFMPGPLMAVYYASKAFVLSFSEALAEETKGTGVTVTCLCPGPSETGFQARAAMEESKLVRGGLMSSEEVVRAGLDAMRRGDPLVIPGLKNKLQAASPRFLPRALVPGIVKKAQDRQ